MYKTIYNEETNLWTGLNKVPLYNLNVSVGQVVLEALDRDPDSLGQVPNFFLLVCVNKVTLNRNTLP